MSADDKTRGAPPAPSPTPSFAHRRSRGHHKAGGYEIDDASLEMIKSFDADAAEAAAKSAGGSLDAPRRVLIPPVARPCLRRRRKRSHTPWPDATGDPNFPRRAWLQRRCRGAGCRGAAALRPASTPSGEPRGGIGVGTLGDGRARHRGRHRHAAALGRPAPRPDAPLWGCQRLPRPRAARQRRARAAVRAASGPAASRWPSPPSAWPANDRVLTLLADPAAGPSGPGGRGPPQRCPSWTLLSARARDAGGVVGRRGRKRPGGAWRRCRPVGLDALVAAGLLRRPPL